MASLILTTFKLLFLLSLSLLAKSNSALIIFPHTMLTSLRAVFNTLLHFISFNCIFCYFKTFQFFFSKKRSTPCIILLSCLALMEFSCKISSNPEWDNTLIFTHLSQTHILTSKMSCFMQRLKACLCSQTEQSLTFPNDWIRKTFHIHSCDNVM